jgi:serpin B
MKGRKRAMSTMSTKIIGLLCCMMACAAQALTSTNETTNNSQSVAAANTTFGFNLLAQLAANNTGSGNIFISPYSASTALQMVSAGAAGTTQKQMQQVLGTSGLPQASLNDGVQKIAAIINSKNTNFTLITANALWYQNGISINTNFIEGNQNFFGASVEAIDFYNSTSAHTINSWASNETQGNITNVVSYPFDPVPSLLLANAVYFKGSWQTPFATNLTVPATFHLKGGQATVPMMNQSGTFFYCATNGYQAIQLPYQGGDLTMDIFLPNTNSSISALLKTLQNMGWQKASQNGFSEQQGSLSLPKFNLNYSVNLIPSLKALGMTNAFSRTPGVADFSNISVINQLYISSVNQQAIIKVDEVGTEAAAVTTIGLASAAIAAPSVAPFSMIVNRPFVFFIEDQQTKTILFMGMVFNPS